MSQTNLFLDIEDNKSDMITNLVDLQKLFDTNVAEPLQRSKAYAVYSLLLALNELSAQEIDSITDLIKNGVFTHKPYTMIEVKNIFGQPRMVLKYE